MVFSVYMKRILFYYTKGLPCANHCIPATGGDSSELQVMACMYFLEAKWNGAEQLVCDPFSIRAMSVHGLFATYHMRC